MTRNFRELQAAMGPDRINRAKLHAREMMMQILLSETHRKDEVSQEELTLWLARRFATPEVRS